MAKSTSPPTPTDPKLWTVAEISKRTSVGIGDINQAVKEGHIPKAGKATYEPAKAIKGLFAFFVAHRSELPAYDNVDQCSQATGVPASLIKAIRRETKAPFTNQRIHLGPLLKEIFKQDDKGEANTDWKQRRERALALKEEELLKDMLGQSVGKSWVERGINEAAAAYRQSRERWEQMEGPSSLKGRTEDEIRERLEQAGRRMDEAFVGKVEGLMKEASVVAATL
jgi:hypothetical protein